MNIKYFRWSNGSGCKILVLYGTSLSTKMKIKSEKSYESSMNDFTLKEEQSEEWSVLLSK